jgi:long-chain acyl-CoA synthetase
MAGQRIVRPEEKLERMLPYWASTRLPDTSPAQLAEEVLEAAEMLLQTGETGAVGRETWYEYLHLTSRPRFLLSLPTRDHRNRWAETTFEIIRRSDFRLLDMFQRRVDAHPDRPLFQELPDTESRSWSYGQIARRLEGIAAIFSSAQPEPPRLAIISENNVDSACCDLTCLFYGIFVAPLSVHFDAATLAWIFDRLRINLVVTDSDDQRQLLTFVRGRVRSPFKVFVIGETSDQPKGDEVLLSAAVAEIGSDHARDILSVRKGRGLDDTATVMFTSGSTGMPKGICFTEYNLLSKRFARGAALPRVGDTETLLCYLPLYHTFGRYLELLGSVYWGGTYVFAGSPSAETLLAGLKQVQPTGLIGVPFRWAQLRDHCLERMSRSASDRQQEEIFRRIVGERLHWGLSAAGHLEPKVFHFFNRHGVALCSGFGMTEATGGVTMTPPGEYFDESVGIPLPGITTRLSEHGELLIAGPYIARYLPDSENTSENTNDSGESWLPTGDLFRVHPNGHYEIVDRIKDIYKNSKGQTVAPRRVEQKFSNVPGIKRTFLVGDGRAYNVLLIVPDHNDPVLQKAASSDSVREYFHQIVTAVNQDLAIYERVVNFELLERDFGIELEELTPKGSYRRRAVEEHFASTIDDLYRNSEIEIAVADLRITIPRWFYRDLGILEDDIVPTEDGLVNRRYGSSLLVHREPGSRFVRVGDLEYVLPDQQVDLGLFARQPRLWAANRALTRFCPCREGWDVSMKGISAQVLLPATELTLRGASSEPLPFVQNHRLKKLHFLAAAALFDSGEASRQAASELAVLLRQSDDRMAGVIQRRLEALARHPDIKTRSLAYRTLLLDEPLQDYSRVFPAFIQSGLPFLDEESVESIARAVLEQRRLEALRQRLHAYRTQLSWPASPVARDQFKNLLRLLVNFARYHPETYVAVREELASWALHRVDPELSAFAEERFDEMSAKCQPQAPNVANWEICWAEKIIFEDGLSSGEIQMLKTVLFGTTMLRQSVMLTFDEPEFDILEVPAGGIWVTRLVSRHQYTRYRITVNTESGKHFDLQLALREDLDNALVRETMLWTISIGGFPHGPAVLPRFGCCRTELGAMSLAYISDLTVWERIREFTSIRPHRSTYAGVRDWQKLFIRALAAVFRAWRNSDYRIVPGAIAPSNVVVPEPDFRQGSKVLSLTGWTPYEQPLSLVRPMIHNFYEYTSAHSPWTREFLELSWIFDASVEALGVEKAKEFLARLERSLLKQPAESHSRVLSERLRVYRQRLDEKYYVPLAVQLAIDRFHEWQAAAPEPTANAREQIIAELYRLYRLDRFPDIARYHLYRHTYFADAGPAVRDTFDLLLREMFLKPGTPPTQKPELSDVQATLHNQEDRTVFTRMVFPKASSGQRVEVLSVGESDRRHAIVRSEITDKQGVSYSVRDPLEPAEIGQLYRLLFKADFPKVVSELDRYLVCVDREGQIIGGVCYQNQDEEVVHLDGVVVTQSRQGRGIGTALLDDFFLRMAAEGARVVKTHFFLRQFCLPRGFQVDRRWGGLVRFLAPLETPAEAD